jgi:putative membrane protein
MIGIGSGELILLFLGLLFLLLIGGLIAGGIWLASRPPNAGGRGRGPEPPEDPLDILRRRYARGEITKEQFEAMRQDLTL